MNHFRTRIPPSSDDAPGQEALRQPALLLELTPVLVCDPLDRITYWNRAAEVMYGFTREQAVGRLSQELLQTRFPEPQPQILARLRSGRQWQGELIQVRSNGARIAVASEWIAHLDPTGELEAVITVNTEITERKRAEEALAKTTSRLDGIVNSAMDAIISVNTEQRIVLFNPAAERMFGVASREAIGQELTRFIPQRFRDAHAHHVERFGQTGVSNRRMGALGNIAALRGNGEEFPAEASISQVEIGGEKLFTVILRDITRRQRAEEDLRRAQAELTVHAENLEKIVAARTAQFRESLSELEAFSYSLSHDLRAPLRAIHTFTRIFVDDYGKDLTPDGAELLNKVLAAAGRMDRLMQEVLAFSRVSRHDLPVEAVDVEKLILDIVMERPELQTPQADITVASPLPPLLANRASLTQCLTNLLSNGVKFVAPGVHPRVRIWAEVRRQAAGGGRLEMEGRPKGAAGSQQPAASSQHPSRQYPPSTIRHVRLWFEDDGIGIEPEALPKLFALFQRFHSQYEGSGLGLAIVRKAVDRMGGAVGVESEPGKGSRFWIELPGA